MGKGVSVGVNVGGIKAAVCVAAAAAVCATISLIAFGIGVGICCGDANVDTSQLISKTTEARQTCKARRELALIRFSLQLALRH